MVAAAYGAFFAASMGAAAALLGLLFVAVSIAPEHTVVRGAPVERQVAADSVFTALINAFFVSMGGALPGINLAVVALPLSVLSLVQALYAGWRLWPRQAITRSSLRPLSLVVASLVIYGFQLADSYQLARDPTNAGAFVGLIALLFATYALGIVRSWQLLGAQRGGFLSVLRGVLGGDADAELTSKPKNPERKGARR
jgi:hypothetical protein